MTDRATQQRLETATRLAAKMADDLVRLAAILESLHNEASSKETEDGS